MEMLMEIEEMERIVDEFQAWRKGEKAREDSCGRLR